MLRDHPHRLAIRDEVHARPVVLVPNACRLRRLVFLPEDGRTVGAILETLRNWCAARGLASPGPETRQYSFLRGTGADGFTVTFGFHNEFTSLTWSSPPGDTVVTPTDIGLEIVADLALVSATIIDIREESALTADILDACDTASLCHVSIESGKAEIATDLVEDEDGFVHYEFAAGALTPLRRSILARRLFEVESYSKLALLGLPEVRAAGAELGALETEISAVIGALPTIEGVEASGAAIAALNNLSLRVAVLTDSLSYRMAASQAYGQIVADRLDTLQDFTTGTGANLSVYVENRVGPALRTLKATEKRLQGAAQKIERAALMINARNGLELGIQNSAILGTISKTARSQFLLQQTVEGLSIIAITYYLIAVLGYALAGPIHLMHWDKEWVMGALTPVALIVVWIGSRLLWRKHQD